MVPGRGEESGGRRRFMVSLALVFLVLLGFSLAESWAKLPKDLPMNYSFDGTPNRSGSRLELLIMVAVLVLVTLPMLAGGWWMGWLRKHPRWINMPRKAELLSLPPESQAPYWELVAEFMAAMAAAMALLFLLLVRGLLAVALESRGTLPAWAVWPGLGVLGLVMLFYLPRMINMPRRLSRGLRREN